MLLRSSYVVSGFHFFAVAACVIAAQNFVFAIIFTEPLCSPATTAVDAPPWTVGAQLSWLSMQHLIWLECSLSNIFPTDLIYKIDAWNTVLQHKWTPNTVISVSWYDKQTGTNLCVDCLTWYPPRFQSLKWFCASLILYVFVTLFTPVIGMCFYLMWWAGDLCVCVCVLPSHCGKSSHRKSKIHTLLTWVFILFSLVAYQQGLSLLKPALLTIVNTTGIYFLAHGRLLLQFREWQKRISAPK